MTESELKIDDVRIELNGRELLRLDRCVGSGEVLTVMGPSGSGKSTLLAYLAGFLAPAFRAHGRVWVGSRDVTDLPAEQRHLGLLFQDPLLFPHLSIAENLCFGIPRNRSDKNRLASASLEEIGLQGFENRDPETLSGGQKARVALLRTLLSEPEAVLLDEPFNKLDAALRAEVRDAVFGRLRTAGLPVVLVTHDREDAEAAGGEVVELG